MYNIIRHFNKHIHNLNKDFTQEISSYTPTIDQSIQDLRKAIQSMSEENKTKSIQYIQNLCKLSKLYVS